MTIRNRRIVTAALAVTLTGSALLLTGCGSSDDKADDSPGGTSSASAGAPTDASSSPTAAAPTTTAATDGGGGLDGLTARQISDKATAAMKALSSVTIDFKGLQDGKPLQLRSAMSSNGNCTSHIVLAGGNLQLIGVDKTMYAKGDDAFWKSQGGAQGAKIVQTLKGRWLKIPPTSTQAQDFDAFCDLNTFMKSFTEDDGGTMKKGSPVKVGDTTTIPISEPQDGGVSTVYVAQSGKPYVLKADETGKDAATGTFSDFDKPVKAAAPPASQTVDSATMGS